MRESEKIMKGRNKKKRKGEIKPKEKKLQRIAKGE